MAKASSILVTAFVQANTIRGYRYLDDAGSIMNEWESKFPSMQVGLDGLKMSNEKDVMREMHVDMKRIWIHFEEPESVESIVRQSRQAIENVSRVIGVDAYSRLAIRVQYIVSAKDDPEFVYETYKSIFGATVRNLLEHSSQENRRLFELTMPIRSGRLSITQRIYPVERTVEGESKDLPPDGIMFDSDISISGPTRLQVIGTFFREVEQWTQEILPGIIDNLVDGGGR